MSENKEIKLQNTANANVPMLVILYEKTIDQTEKDCLRSIVGFNLIHKMDSKSKTQKLEDILKSYTCVMVDMRKDEIREWYLSQRKYIEDNSENVLCIFVHKSGEHLSNEKIVEHKKALKCKYVRKNLTKSAKTYPELITYISGDHVPKNFINLSIIEKIINLIKGCLV